MFVRQLGICFLTELSETLPLTTTLATSAPTTTSITESESEPETTTVFPTTTPEPDPTTTATQEASATTTQEGGHLEKIELVVVGRVDIGIVDRYRLIIDNNCVCVSCVCAHVRVCALSLKCTLCCQTIHHLG